MARSPLRRRRGRFGGRDRFGDFGQQQQSLVQPSFQQDFGQAPIQGQFQQPQQGLVQPSFQQGQPNVELQQVARQPFVQQPAFQSQGLVQPSRSAAQPQITPQQPTRPPIPTGGIVPPNFQTGGVRPPPQGSGGIVPPQFETGGVRTDPGEFSAAVQPIPTGKGGPNIVPGAGQDGGQPLDLNSLLAGLGSGGSPFQTGNPFEGLVQNIDRFEMPEPFTAPTPSGPSVSGPIGMDNPLPPQIGDAVGSVNANIRGGGRFGSGPQGGSGGFDPAVIRQQHQLAQLQQLPPQVAAELKFGPTRGRPIQSFRGRG